MKTLLVPAILILALVSVAVPLSAHHAWPVSYERLVTVKGTVVEFTWANPHPMMTLAVRTDDGRTEQWQIGGPALNRMESNGWTKTTVKPGDVLTGIGYQFADGQKIIRLERVVLARCRIESSCRRPPFVFRGVRRVETGCRHRRADGFHAWRITGADQKPAGSFQS